MSSRNKGMQYEKEFEKLLQDWGYTTERARGSTKFNKKVDMFGLWDIISFNKEGWLFAQVKTDYRNKVYEELKEWFDKFLPPKTCAVYAIRKKGKIGAARWKIAYVGQNQITINLPIKVKQKKSLNS